MKKLATLVAFALCAVVLGATQTQAQLRGGGKNQTALHAPALVQTAAAARRSCRTQYGPVRRGGVVYGPAFRHLVNRNCWSCPAGFHPTAAPNVRNPRACKRNGTTLSAPARRHGRAGGLTHTRCPKRDGQFADLLSGYCFSCPPGYRPALGRVNHVPRCARKIAARFASALYRGHPPGPACGARNRRPCLVTERIPSCDPGLVEDFLINKCVRRSNSLRRLAGQCFRRWKPVVREMTSIAKCMVTSGITKRLGAVLKAKRAPEALRMLVQGPCGSRVQQVARVLRAAGFRSMTLGVSGDVAVGIGANSEFFAAIATGAVAAGPASWGSRPPRLYIYETLGWQFGFALGGGVNAVVGAYEPVSSNLAGKGQGFSFSAKALGGGGGALSLDYRPACAGLSAHAGPGVEVNAMSATRFKTIRLH
jgi:hypothetical protein